MMKREYLNENVYEALQRRLNFLFEEFDNIFVSISGGKDSGLLLNLVLDFQKAHYPDKRIGVFHQDFEAQYSATTEYVERTFARIEAVLGLPADGDKDGAQQLRNVLVSLGQHQRRCLGQADASA